MFKKLTTTINAKALLKLVYAVMTYLPWFWSEVETKDGKLKPAYQGWRFWAALATIVGTCMIQIGFFPLDSVYGQVLAWLLIIAAMMGFRIPSISRNADKNSPGYDYLDTPLDELYPEEQEATVIGRPEIDSDLHYPTDF